MATKRMINCDFLNASKFKTRLSNKAKLLYMYMFINADDKGFVDTTEEIMDTLTNNDVLFHSQGSLDLVDNTYQSALSELINNGLVYEFLNRHNEKTHLIRHWHFHNIMLKNPSTNYNNLLKRVKMVENEYMLKTENDENKEREDKGRRWKRLDGNRCDENKDGSNINKKEIINDNNEEKSVVGSKGYDWDAMIAELEDNTPKGEELDND